MIEHEVEQGSPEWFALRLGIPTASEFSKIVTPTGKLSSQSRDYAIYLVTQKLLNRSLDSLDNLEWVERGKELEPDAVRQYEFEQEIETRKAGFCTTDDGKIGASPDRFIVGKRGGCEIKCPAPHTHVGYMVDGFDNKYKPQVQGQIFVCEFEFVDWYSYHPEMPPVRIRTYRDTKFVSLLAESIASFNEMKDEIEATVRDKGYFAEVEKIRTAADVERGEREEPTSPGEFEAPFGEEPF